MSGADDEDRQDVIDRFGESVNMTAGELDKWLATDESREVGQKSGDDAESTGHASGRRIVELLRTKKGDLSGSDLAHMRKVSAYVRRHTGQRPEGDITETRWRYSLMNWGHDPTK
ncbi:DUF3140 domain-containing protein [Streptomyces sp. NPDC005775]|uniref:DUF3140 domain-containing protein n=1 Tax=unclassified Streptomyces TaxID=2593676 RepID=UPI0033EDC547